LSAEAKGARILWIPISHSSYHDEEFSNYQAMPDPKYPLDSLSASEQNRELVKICQEIKRLATGTNRGEK
jgi:hypothetical protein